ncbi:MAG TPA: efflux RND transporter permease subunit [Vicinamibacterales bacterium]|nr:efflux RND transporter permease subunit [Vicinamibacterales bacterium]
MSIPRLAIHRPVTMFMLSGVIVLLGVVSLSKLPVDLMPEFTQPTITVNTNYPNVGPLEIEELITRPIEQSVSAVAGITRVDSSSREGGSNVRLNFAWGTNLDAAADDVRSRLDRVRGRLPEEADPPTIFKADSNAFPIMQIGVEGDYDPVTLRELAENDLSPRLERAPGVAAVTINGGLRRQIHVDLSKEKITALNLSVDRVVQALKSENQNLPLGQIDQGDSTYLVRSQGQFVNIDDIRDLVVLTRQNVPVYLRDVADVTDSTEDRRQFLRITSRDASGSLGEGHAAVRMQINKQSGENTVAVAQAIRAEVARINRDVPGVRLVVLDDSAIFIERAINNVKEHALVGGILVVLIIFAFLRDFRSTLIVCTSIPISVIGTFALLYFGGFTLNTMTFGGLALGIGMIVDAAIVVLENTHRHLHMGKDRMTAAIDGSEEVWSAILASTLTHIAVFVPLLFLQGISSILFTQLSFVVMFSLSMSLFVAVTIVPVLCSRWLHTPDELRKHTGVLGRFYRASENFLEGVDDGYRRAIHLALQHRPTVIGAAAGLVALAAVLYPRVGTELLPQTDEGQVNVNAQLPIGTRMEITEAVMYRLEDMVKESVPEVTTIVTNGGGGGGGFGGGGNTNRGGMQVKLVPRDERTRSSDEIAQDLRRRLSGIPGAIVRANPGGGNFQLNFILGGGQDARLSLEIRGHDLDDAKRIQQQAIGLMMDTPGIADVRTPQDDARPELAIHVDRPKAAMLGLTVNGVAQTIQTNVAGTTAAQFRQRGNEYPIVVRLREADREQIQDIGDVLVNTPSGQVVPARNLLAVNRETGPVQIDRKNMERIVRVNAEPEVALSDAVTNVQGRLGQVRVPQDFSVGFGSEVEEQAKSFNQLKIVLILAVLLVYAVMASQYESLRDPFIIMFSIPTASIGIVGGLLLTRTAFSMQAYIGVIMLAGIVVSNAILLVDYINTLRRRDGMPLREAVEIGGRTRLRPVLMTSIATMLGLVPMAIGIGDGGELQAPLARVVIGGLLASTMVTLVLIPAVYTLFEEGWKGLRHHHAE